MFFVLKIVFMATLFGLCSLVQGEEKPLSLSLEPQKLWRHGFASSNKQRISGTPGEFQYTDLTKMVVPTLKTSDDAQLDFLFGKTGASCADSICFGFTPIPAWYTQSENGKQQYLVASTGGRTFFFYRHHFWGP